LTLAGSVFAISSRGRRRPGAIRISIGRPQSGDCLPTMSPKIALARYSTSARILVGKGFAQTDVTKAI